MEASIVTAEQKQRLLEMRAAGMGYSRIASNLAISVNTVKSFCQRNEKEKAKPQPQPLAMERQRPEFCKNCGKPIVQLEGRKTRVYCSDRCRMAWWNSHLEEANREKLVDHTCRTCGKVFTAYGRKKRTYCSHECYIRMRFGGGLNG